jgi:hypothetical protein
MSLQGGQPSVRFNLAGPFGQEGVSFLPKIATVKLAVAAAGNYDFMTMPAGTFVAEVIAHVAVALDGTPTVNVGTDANSDAFIDTLDFDATTVNTTLSSAASTNANSPNGLYLAAADTLRIAVGGTPTTGEVHLLVKWYEMDSMFAEPLHFEGSLS